MTQQMTFPAPASHMVWIAGGLMCGLAGLGLDLVLSGQLGGAAARYGAMGAAFGAGIGLISLARKLFAKR